MYEKKTAMVKHPTNSSKIIVSQKEMNGNWIISLSLK